MSKELTAAHRLRNQALLRFVVLPVTFLTVALLGGLRVQSEGGAFMFIAPPLVTLILAVLLVLLFVRGALIDPRAWMSSHNSLLTNLGAVSTFVALFFASAQAFNSVLPERGLLNWLFSFFFLWTLWNNQFSSFDARRLVRSLIVLFGTAFFLKHMLFANLYGPDSGWLQRLAGSLVQGISLGTLDAPTFLRQPVTFHFSLLLFTFADCFSSC